jgi:hypothetical protein
MVPFRTMQAALEEALDGDFISISPGYYAEQLMIERDNVRIVGKVREWAKSRRRGGHGMHIGEAGFCSKSRCR